MIAPADTTDELTLEQRARSLRRTTIVVTNTALGELARVSILLSPAGLALIEAAATLLGTVAADKREDA